MNMKRYVPSVKNNNELRTEAVNKLNALVYGLERGKHDEAIDAATLTDVCGRLRNAMTELVESVCTGGENIGAVYAEAVERMDGLRKAAGRPSAHRFVSEAEDLLYSLELWRDVLGGELVLDTSADVAKAKKSRQRRKLDERLSELEAVRESFMENGRRLEREITGLEADISEYESRMVEEDNERKIGDLFRRIEAAKSKLDMLNIRRNNYSACYDLLDVIHVNAKEILAAGEQAGEEEIKAKVLLDIDKLKRVAVEPDKAIAILRRMEADVKELAGRTASIDKKIFGIDSGSSAVSADALRYKEELMRKKREREELEKLTGDGSASAGKIKTEDNKNGIF